MINNLEHLISHCRSLASLRGEAISNCNPKKANKLFKELISCLPKIRSFGQDGESALLLLAEDNNDDVACWAATHSLKYNTEQAMASLRRISGQQSLIGFDAAMVIEQWNKGELILPD